MALQPTLSLLVLCIEVSSSHTVGRTPLYERSARRRGLYLHRTTQHTNRRDKYPSPERDSNSRFQQPNDGRTTPETARPPKSDSYNITFIKIIFLNSSKCVYHFISKEIRTDVSTSPYAVSFQTNIISFKVQKQNVSTAVRWLPNCLIHKLITMRCYSVKYGLTENRKTGLHIHNVDAILRPKLVSLLYYSLF
jgi:hypothetical protein